MSTTTAPESPSTGPAPDEVPGLRRSPWRIIGWIALWVCLGLLLIGFVLGLFLVAAGSDSDPTSVSVESADPADTAVATDTESPADAEATAETLSAEITVDTPEPGEVFVSGSSLSGTTSSERIAYRLLAGGTVVAEGTVDVADGAFSTTVDFTNTCCIEMLLEVMQPGDARPTLAVPLAFPEPG